MNDQESEAKGTASAAVSNTAHTNGRRDTSAILWSRYKSVKVGIVSAPVVPPDVRRSFIVAGSLTVFASAFLFRFLSVEFTNDHFVHLTRAKQILYGEVPIRDFFDPGMILTHYASAVPLALFGHTLLGEAVLTAGFIALGTMLTFLLATRLTGSVPAGLGAALVAAATVPRLYNYPKVFLFVLAIACIRRYARNHSLSNLSLLALVTVTAFLFRHDHGAYVGVSVSGALVVAHWGDWRRAARVLGQYGGITAALLLPWVVFVQSTAGLPAYFQSVIPQMRDVTTPRFNWLPISIDTSAPLYVAEPAPESRIFVRWGPGATADLKRERESRYGLTAPQVDEEPTWSYALAEPDNPDLIRRLIEDPLVEDTSGLDRSRHRLTSVESTAETLRRLLAGQIAPGVLTGGNALAWLYYMTMILPLVGLATLAAGVRYRRIAREEVVVTSALILLCLIIGQALVRSAPQARLADTAAPIAVLGAWVTWRWRHGLSASTHGWQRPARATLVTAVWLLTLWSAGTVGHADAALGESGLLAGYSATRQRLTVAWQELHGPPAVRWVGDLYDLTQYVRACTAPSDRLLVLWFAPEVPFYAERPFAGGQECLQIGWNASIPDQQLTIERMTRQRVPIVLADGPFDDHPSRHEFALIYAYVRDRYRVVTPSTPGSAGNYSVLVDRQLVPTGTDSRFGLPCYR